MKKKQWQGWGPGEQAEQHYLVQPRALAGGGDVRHVSEFLRASGWRDKSKTGGPLFMESPDRTVRVAYDPYVLPGGWTIHGRADGASGEWSAHLGRQAPVEIVAGLTDALTRPRSAHAPNVWAPLQEQNWHTRFEGEHYVATSPDGTAWMQYRQNPDGAAMWWTGAQDKQGNGWTAHFTPNTPMHLVQAFSTELASPDPVMRPRGRVPHSAQIRTWSVSVKPSQLSAWQQASITAARARHLGPQQLPKHQTAHHRPSPRRRRRRTNPPLTTDTHHPEEPDARTHPGHHPRRDRHPVPPHRIPAREPRPQGGTRSRRAPSRRIHRPAHFSSATPCAPSPAPYRATRTHRAARRSATWSPSCVPQRGCRPTSTCSTTSWTSCTR